jgi:predicted PurR-regulated permease PerM
MTDQSPRLTPWRDYRKYAFPLLWAFILAALFLLREILAPFIGALLIAYLLAPLVARLNRLTFKERSLSVPRWVGVLLIYAVLGLSIWGYGMVAVPKIGAEFGKLAKEGEKLFMSLTPEKIEEYVEKARTWLEESGLPVHIVTPAMEQNGGEPRPGFVLNLDEVIHQSVHELTETLRSNFFAFLTLGPRFAVKTFRFILMTFLILMVAAFLMTNPQKPLGLMRSLFPKRLHEGYTEVAREIDIGLSGVVRGQVLICLVNGVLTFIGMIILGVKFPVMLSTLAAVMSLIPIFGSILSSIPIVIVALTTGFMTGLGALLWIVGIHLVEANLLNPKIMGESAKIHPALVVFALVAGEHFYGIVGALFAVPIASVGLAFFKVIHRRAIMWNKATHDKDEPEEPAKSSIQD